VDQFISGRSVNFSIPQSALSIFSHIKLKVMVWPFSIEQDRLIRCLTFRWRANGRTEMRRERLS
jgi:hypothetical protein